LSAMWSCAGPSLVMSIAEVIDRRFQETEANNAESKSRAVF
jgi:hypothetical protein